MHKVIMEIVFIYRPFLQDITMLFSLKSLSARRIPSLAHLRKEGRKDWFVVGWFVLVDYCRVWYLHPTLV